MIAFDQIYIFKNENIIRINENIWSVATEFNIENRKMEFFFEYQQAIIVGLKM